MFTYKTEYFTDVLHFGSLLEQRNFQVACFLEILVCTKKYEVSISNTDSKIISSRHICVDMAESLPHNTAEDIL
jgi:hypothetical protein